MNCASAGGRSLFLSLCLKQMHKQTNLPRVGEEPVAQVHPQPGRRRKRRRRSSRFTAQAAARQGQLSLILTTSPVKRECGVRVQSLLLHDSSLPSSSSYLPVSSLRSRLLLLRLSSSSPASSPSASASSRGRRAGSAQLGFLPWPGLARLGTARLPAVALVASARFSPPPLPSTPECSAETYMAPPRRRPKGDCPTRRPRRASAARPRSQGPGPQPQWAAVGERRSGSGSPGAARGLSSRSHSQEPHECPSSREAPGAERATRPTRGSRRAPARPRRARAHGAAWVLRMCSMRPKTWPCTQGRTACEML